MKGGAFYQEHHLEHRNVPFPVAIPGWQRPLPFRVGAELQVFDRRCVLDERGLGPGGIHEGEAEWKAVESVDSGGYGYDWVAFL